VSYNISISDRLGRTNSREQYVFMYRWVCVCVGVGVWGVHGGGGAELVGRGLEEGGMSDGGRSEGGLSGGGGVERERDWENKT